MTINELLNTMTESYRESLFEIIADDEKLECTVDPEYLESEVDHWHIDNSRMYIVTRQYFIAEIQKRNRLRSQSIRNTDDADTVD